MPLSTPGEPLRLNVRSSGWGDRCSDPLFSLYAEAEIAIRSGRDLVLHFGQCEFLNQSAVVFLGGLIREAQRAGSKVYMDDSSLAVAVKENLGKNGFLQKLGLSTRRSIGNSIPFRQDFEAADLMRYLREDWLGRGWVKASNAVQDLIATAVWEIYSNAFEHGRSAIGVFSCGQRYPHKQEIALAVADFGAGIPREVRTVPAQKHLSDHRAIEWALGQGTTSKPGNRGNGLGILSNFIRVNRGQVEILSRGGYAKIAGGRRLLRVSAHEFPGTLINITLKQDERRYVLASEIEGEIL